MPPTTPDSQTTYPGVILGEGTVAEPFCVLGKVPRGCETGELQLVIGSAGTVRSFTTIYAGSTSVIGFRAGTASLIREDNVIGDDVSIGTNAVLEAGNRIGTVCASTRDASSSW